MRNKKGSGALDNLAGLAVAVATLAIVLTVAFLIMSQGKSQISDVEGLDLDGDGVLNATECQNSLACNGTTTMVTATDTIPGWVPLIIIATVGAILLGLVKMFTKG